MAHKKLTEIWFANNIKNTGKWLLYQASEINADIGEENINMRGFALKAESYFQNKLSGY